MPDDRTRAAAAERTAEERAADHAVIVALADDLLPALVAKLAATSLGEIEVREGSWRLRVRRPAHDGTDRATRAGDNASRSQPGHAGHGHPPAGFEGHRSAREARPGSAAATAHSGNGAAPQLTAVGPGPERDPDTAPRPSQAIATSPAVGIYQPRSSATPGTRVRAGDRLGAVDMLGIAQEVVAPADGLIGASLVEPGQAVEYGQDLVVVELAIAPAREA